ncbi:MAG: AI-2E family transporter, partial [Sphingomonadales bacterium]
MTFKNWQLWLGIGLVVLLVYATKAILLPFLMGLAVAYLLDPVADKFESWKFPRWVATVTVLFLFFLAMGGFVFAIFPLLRAQLGGFITSLPDYFAAARPIFTDFWAWFNETFEFGKSLNTDNFIEEASKTALAKLGDILAGFWSGGMAVFNLLTLLLITPVVAFFMLRDWDILIAKIDSLVPRKNRETVRKVSRDIDTALGGFVRGQTMAALIMAFIYAVGWSFVGLEYALVLGLIGGIMAYIPFVGALFTLLLALLIGIGQYGLDYQLLLVFLVYGVVQGIEGVFLTPNLVGSKVRLHPVWVLFAIFAGGEIMGFTGVLIAVPAAAVIGVLVRFYVGAYLDSSL